MYNNRSYKNNHLLCVCCTRARSRVCVWMLKKKSNNCRTEHENDAFVCARDGEGAWEGSMGEEYTTKRAIRTTCDAMRAHQKRSTIECMCCERDAIVANTMVCGLILTTMCVCLCVRCAFCCQHMCSRARAFDLCTDCTGHSELGWSTDCKGGAVFVCYLVSIAVLAKSNVCVCVCVVIRFDLFCSFFFFCLFLLRTPTYWLDYLLG